MAPVPQGTLVVGAGQAGLSLVTRLRELGDADHRGEPLVLVGAEDLPPYERPPLSKTYLRGEHDRASLVLRDAHWYAAQSIDLVLGDPVVAIDRDADGGAARLASGREVEFARLALTTGADNRSLDVEGSDLDGVVALRTVREADELARRLDIAREVVVLGGGFIGLEVAASARMLGRSVTVVELADRLLSRAVTPALSDFYLEAHRRRGTRIILQDRAIRLLGSDGHVTGVELDSGEQLDADLVVVGIGAAPRTELAASLRLSVAPGGVVVDARALTSDGVTVAAGDCTIGPNPFSRSRSGLMRLESVPHATDQARTAAATLLGHPAAYDAVPWFWSDQADLRLQIAGLVDGADLTVRRGEDGAETFSLLSYRDGLLVAGECVGRPADYMAVKRGLEKGLTIDPQAATDPTVPLKRLLRDVEDVAGTPGTSRTSGS